MLLSKLLPKEGNFFELFNQHADRIVEAANAFSLLVAHYGDLGQREKYARDVDNAERAADRVTEEVNRLIHTTFITPIDREQIHGLINLMDDVADLLQDSAETMALYDIHHMTEEIVRLTELSVKCCQRVQAAVRLLGKIAEPTTAEATLKTCEEIDRLESDADRVMRSAMSKLFREEPDVREVIKLKAIYELLETITDKCEDVANQIEGIVLENSITCRMPRGWSMLHCSLKAKCIDRCRNGLALSACSGCGAWPCGDCGCNCGCANAAWYSGCSCIQALSSASMASSGSPLHHLAYTSQK